MEIGCFQNTSISQPTLKLPRLPLLLGKVEMPGQDLHRGGPASLSLLSPAIAAESYTIRCNLEKSKCCSSRPVLFLAFVPLPPM